MTETKIVDGQTVLLTQAEIDAQAAQDAAWQAAQPRLTLIAQISTLEATQTPRRVREAVNGIDNGWLKKLDAQIATLRGQLK